MLQKSPIYSYVPVKDLARARSFYEEKLGFANGREQAAGVHYDCAGGTAFFVYLSDGAGTNKASHGVLDGEGRSRRGRGTAREGRGIRGVRQPRLQDGGWDRHRRRRHDRLVQGPGRKYLGDRSADLAEP